MQKPHIAFDTDAKIAQHMSLKFLLIFFQKKPFFISPPFFYYIQFQIYPPKKEDLE